MVGNTCEIFVCLFVFLSSVVCVNRQENSRARLHKPETEEITGWTAQTAESLIALNHFPKQSFVELKEQLFDFQNVDLTLLDIRYHMLK